MEYELLEQRIFLQDAEERSKLENLLNNEGINLDKNIDYTMGIYHGEELIATGSFFKNIVKCVAVSSKYQGLGVLNKVVSHLMNEQYLRGYTHTFVYTKCNAAELFSYLGFYEIARVEDTVVFMENKPEGIQKYIEELSQKKVDAESIACIVMNANPFTLGHLHLVEKASNENDVLHIFVVSEEASVIPFKVRYELIKRGTNHLKNVILHSTSNYIVSQATFPSYFIKEERNVVEAHARLDLEVFIKYIVPSLGIKTRYVGDEPYCEVTKTYNRIMQETLECKGIQCKVIPRLEYEGNGISASKVRELIRNNEFEGIKGLVPLSTYEYLQSSEAKELLNKIKINIGRH